MKYKVGDKVRVRGDLRRGESIFFGVVEPMAAMAGSVATISEVREGDPEAYKLMEDPGGFSWCEQMFEPVEQFSSGGIVPVNDPRLSDIEVRYPGFINTAEEERYIIRADKVPSGAMCAAFQGTLESLRAFATKKSTGIESRKDIRKRLLKL